MPNRIAGITIEIGADTTALSKALKDTNKDISAAQSSLRDVNKLLKFDPKNTELLSQKQQYLTQAIEGTKKKLDTEKEALEQLKAGPQTEETVKQQENLTREISATESQLNKLKDQYSEFGSVAGQKIQSVGKSIQDVGGKIQKVGGSLTKFVTVPLTGAAAAAGASWKEVDEAMDTVTTKTGQTGKSLQELQEAAEDIANTIPVSFQEAADAVGEVNTRFGLTGKACQDLSTQFTKFAKLNGTAVSDSVDKVQKTMDAFGVSSSKASAVLDLFTKVGQDTGISMDTLESDLTNNATAFQSLGMDIDDSAKLMGKLEKSGVSTSVVLTGLSKVQINAAKDGRSMADELSMALSDSQSAIDIFGSKAGIKLYESFENGTLSVNDFVGAAGGLDDTLGTVSNTFEETLNPADQMQVTLNNLKTIGYDIVNAAGPMLADIMGDIRDAAEDLKEKWEDLTPAQQEAAIKIAAVAAAAGPAISTVGTLTKGIGSLTEGIGKLVGKGSAEKALSGIGVSAGMSTTAVLGIAGAMGAAGVAAGVMAGKLWENSTEAGSAQKEIDKLTDSVKGHNSELDDSVQKSKDTIKSYEDQSEMVDQLKGRMEQLQGQTSLTASEQDEMRGAVDTLNGLYPDLGLQIDNVTGKLTEESTARLDNVDSMMKEATAAAMQEVITDLVKKRVQAEMDLKDLQDKQQEAYDAYSEKQSDLQKQALDTGTAEIALNNDRLGALNEANAAVDAQKEKVQEVNDQLNTARDVYNEVSGAISNTTQATNEQGEAQNSLNGGITAGIGAIGELNGANQENNDTTHTLTDEQKALIDAYNEAAQSALDSANSQVGAFDKIKSDSDVTLSSMEKGLESQTKAFSNYASNMNSLTKYAASTGNSNLLSLLSTIGDMGIKGADYLQQLTDAAEKNNGSLEEILSDYGSANEAKEEFAESIAGMKSAASTGTTSIADEIKGKSGTLAKAGESAGESAAQGVDSGMQSGDAKGAAEGMMSDAKSGVTSGGAGMAKEAAAQARETAVKMAATITASTTRAKVATAGMMKAIQNTVKSGMAPVPSLMSKPIGHGVTQMRAELSSAVRTARSEVAQLKSAFSGVEFSFKKHIDVPHFSMHGSFNAQTGQVPSVSTSWYAKAMHEAILLNGATIFGAMNGNLLGGGERGSEMVLSPEYLMRMIQEAQAGAPAAGAVPQTVYVDMTVNGSEDPEAFGESFGRALQRYARMGG